MKSIKFILNITYFVMLVIFTSILFNGCCPGAPSLLFKKYYSAEDFMKYECSVECLLSKLDSYEENQFGYSGVLNSDESIVLEIQDDTLRYFNLSQYGDNEQLGQIFNYYRIRASNMEEFKYLGSFTFEYRFLKWKTYVVLTPEKVSTMSRRIG